MKSLAASKPAAKSSVTLSDIATRAGVSLNTVSRVMSGKAEGKYPKAKLRAERIQRIASEMNYRANTAARATASGKFQAIGLLFRDDGTTIGSHMVYGVNQVLREHDQRLLLSPIHRSREMDDTPAVLRDLSVDGLLVSLMQDVPPDFQEIVTQTRTPIIWLNAKLDQDCVRPDDRNIAHNITTHLLERGHRRIAYLGHADTRISHYSAADRHEGYRAAMAEAGLESLNITAGKPGNKEATQQAIQDILTLDPRPTAIVCGNDDFTLPLLYAAALRGIAVPSDLSVMSILNSDRDPLGADPAGALVPFRKVGEIAAMMLQQRIETGQHQPAQIIKATIKLGRTVASWSPDALSE